MKPQITLYHEKGRVYKWERRGNAGGGVGCFIESYEVRAGSILWNSYADHCCSDSQFDVVIKPDQVPARAQRFLGKCLEDLAATDVRIVERNNSV